MKKVRAWIAPVTLAIMTLTACGEEASVEMVEEGYDEFISVSGLEPDL